MRATLQQSKVTISGLEACNNYWTVATAIYCGRRSDSEPVLTGFSDAVQFQLAVSLDRSGTACSDWISMDPQKKITDMENGLRSAEASCGFQIPCFRNSSWECSIDNTKASFQ